MKKFLFIVYTCLFVYNCFNLFAADPRDSVNLFSQSRPVLKEEKFSFETEDVMASDQIIRDHLMEKFPIISENTINKIISGKTIFENPRIIIDSLLEYSPPVFKVTFSVPENFLVDSAKILWELNIPEFQSRLYQLYQGHEIHLDTWPNVVGSVKTKTYTGNFQAYRIRNWPFYKDPEPSKAHLPPVKPGPENPLGLFVVHYDENSLRYFHGTNQPKVLSNKMRNVSHGCVRNDNDNIEKIKVFIIKKVIKSEDLSSWIGSKKTLIHDFEEGDKFPVKIIYKTYELGSDITGKYIILFRDIYNYKNSDNIDNELNDAGLITLAKKENIIAEYEAKFGKDIPGDAMDLMIEYIIKKGVEYEKYYFEDLKRKFMLN